MKKGGRKRGRIVREKGKGVKIKGVGNDKKEKE